jgi:hypothetical protein
VNGPAAPPGFRQVLGFQGGPLRLAADAWGALADQARRCADAMVAPVRSAEESWDGLAARVAVRRAGRLHRTVDTTWPPLRSLQEALGTLADGGDRLRGQAWDLVSRARAAGVSIDLDGRVTPAGAALDLAGAAMAAFRREVSDVLAGAARLDQQVRLRLADHAPWTGGRSRAFVARASVPAPGSDPALVHRWWSGLEPAGRRFLIMTHPGLVGGLHGVPVHVRDQANRIGLARARQRLGDRLADLVRRGREVTRDRERARLPLTLRRAQVAELAVAGERRAVEGKLAALDLLERELSGPAPGHRRSYLLELDTSGDGQVVLALGNPDRSDHVLAYVPGAGSALPGLASGLDRTRRMAGDTAAAAPHESTAVVYWLGYDAPDSLVDATSSRYAGAAAGDLRRFSEGLRTTHTGEGAHTTFVGHSYGSTVIGRTAVGGLRADDVVFVGSPGAAAGSATELDIDGDPTRHVWSTTALSDPVRLASRRAAMAGPPALTSPWLRAVLAHLPDQVHGRDPSHPDFGGRVFDADLSSGHSGYWDRGNTARVSIARIAVGRYGDVHR